MEINGKALHEYKAFLDMALQITFFYRTRMLRSIEKASLKVQS
jgi:hypothetical protein